MTKQRQAVEVFWLQGRVFFTLIYQTWRLASYYLDYSLTSAVQLCETWVFTTCWARFPRGVSDKRMGQLIRIFK